MADTVQLKALRRIVQDINAAPNLHIALDTVVSQVAQEMAVDACSIYLFDERYQRYVLMATQGLNAQAVGRVSIEVGEGLVGWVGQREEIINLADASAHARYVPIADTDEEQFSAFLGVPIMYRRKVTGVMVARSRTKNPFSEAEESFLMTLCAQLSAAIAYAHLVGNIDVFRKTPSASSYQTFQGVAGANGIALGRAVIFSPVADLSTVPDRETEEIEEELAKLDQAVIAVREDIKKLDTKMKDSLMSDERALFSVFLRMLDDNALPAEIKALVSEGQWAQGAVRQVVERHTLLFAQMEDDYLKERVSDLKDLGRRILVHLQITDPAHHEITEDTILVSEEISTAALVELPVDNIAAIVTTEGAANSHMVIVARALGIPTVVGVTELPLNSLDDVEIIVDAYQGRVFIHPPRRLRSRYKDIKKEEEQLAKELKQYEQRDAITPDGTAVPLLVNTGLMIDVVKGVQRGAKGVGLYRSEIPFMLRGRFPGEEEQRLIYRQQLSHFANKPVVMRTLDIGADKDLPYFSIEEDNSALGWRGIRFTLDHPEIFSSQIRAMLKASIGLDNLHILLPMITSVSEVEEVLYLLERDLLAVQEEEQVKIMRPKVGVMIEVPSVLWQIDALASMVDFFSVGSNDLTQYLLAVDRNNSHVANLYSHFHPAVIQVLTELVQKCHQQQKPVSICGEMAGDPLSAILLMAMGFDSLSMSASNILKVRKAICHVPLSDAKALLDEALTLDNTFMIKSLLQHYFKAHNLADLIGSTRAVTRAA